MPGPNIQEDLGMKNISQKGFTLIELLVVVLIIGILTAIALPQYEKAVHKARFAENLVRAKRLEQAADLYILENSYPTGNTDIDFAENDPELMSGLTYNEDQKVYVSKYGKYHVGYKLEPFSSGVSWMANYYNADGTRLVELWGFRSSNSAEWERNCFYEENIGKALCNSLISLGYNVDEGF